MTVRSMSRGGSETLKTPEFTLDHEMAKATAENFPVASRFIPSRYRAHLLAIYGYARFVDDVGDLSEGDRLGKLDWVEAELDRTFANEATHPVFVRLGGSIRDLHLDRQPFADLLAANRLDQLVTRYESCEQLLQYCALSANPVGRLVLAVFNQASASAISLSDDVCTGLQLVEHWQDVSEDYAAGRVYLPGVDLERFAVSEQELGSKVATPAFRRLLAFEAGRARDLLASGHTLTKELTGAARLAVAGFVGGGLAQIEAIEKASYDVLSSNVKASKASVLRHTLSVYSGARSKAS